jgi:predicted dehydrogenase
MRESFSLSYQIKGRIMAAAKKYRVAVIGRTGKGNYGHGLDVVWLGLDNVEIIAVADENDKGRADAAARLKAKSAYADFKEMLAKEKPQIVSVADRWLDNHRDMVIACAEAGASVFLEKPLCRTLLEADEMTAACAKHHVKLAIAHQTRYSPRLKVVKEMIAAGQLGDVLELRARGKEDNRGGGQDMMVLGTHLMDLLRLLSGNPKWCFGRIWQDGRKALAGDVRPGGEGMGPILGDRIFAEYGFDNGVVGTFATHKANHGATRRFGLQVFGSKGIIQLTTGSLPPIYFLDDPSWTPGSSKAAWQEVTSAGVGKPEPLAAPNNQALGNLLIAKDLIDAIENDRQPLGNIDDARAALEMILAVYESHRLDRPVDLPLKNRKHPLESF